MEDKILFHGSRGEIDGEIAPISRVRCDFGKGFYMGEDSYQAKALVADDTSPYKYQLDGMYLNQIIKNASEYCKKNINEPCKGSSNLNNIKANRDYER